ncbi:MAG: type II toxin-antitoxin system HicA family toxin [Actinomycetota bacterium]|nr:type II toxin-antitoxin system HicA family toxin [Actinomycetota bacterium]
MPKLPVCSGKEAVRAFERLGYERVRQTSSHVRMKCAGREPLSIPLSDPVKRGLLRDAIRDSGFTVEEFRENL